MRSFAFVLASFGLFSEVAQGLHRRQTDLLASCTQTDPALLDACVASAVDVFTSTLGLDTSTFNAASLSSEINSITSGLSSFGLTASVPAVNPATITGTSSYSGPYVSDIVSSYSEYTKTHRGTGGSAFSFETSKFTPNPSSSSETTNTATPAPTSPGSSSTPSTTLSPLSARAPRSGSSELWMTLLLGTLLGAVVIFL